jgi:hypothetical protein
MFYVDFCKFSAQIWQILCLEVNKSNFILQYIFWIDFFSVGQFCFQAAEFFFATGRKLLRETCQPDGAARAQLSELYTQLTDTPSARQVASGNPS